MDGRCRLCADCFPFLIPIIDDLDFCSKIFQLFQIRVAIGDTFPVSVCQQCYNMVEKTWHFNNRIQKAQEILSGLIPTISVLTTTEPLVHPAAVDPSVLDDKNMIITTEMVELTYIDEKEIDDTDFLTEEPETLTEISEKLESKKRINGKLKNKVGKFQLRDQTIYHFFHLALK